MLPSTCVVVPTYWTRRGGEALPGDAVYDHPTPVDGTSTLPALLDSLETLHTSSFYLLILVAVAGHDAASDAERRVAEMMEQHPKITSLVFGPSHLLQMHEWLDGRSLQAALSFLDLQNYPKIRNLQLALPIVLGSSAIVALDDDEIVTDRAFLDKAIEPLGSTIDGQRVDGLSGHYLQESGSILLQVDPAKAGSTNVFDRKAVIMNEATEMLEKQAGNIIETPFCFGGNMEFTADLAASVGFDPGITRGEDIDYLINARIEGRRFFLRKDLTILHCPPKGGSYKDVSRSKLEQDIIRFLYERGKLQVSQTEPELIAVTPAQLMPYPGEFLERDIEEDAVYALEAAHYPGDAAEFVRDVQSSLPQRLQHYLTFRCEWPRALGALSSATPLRDALLSQVRHA